MISLGARAGSSSHLRAPRPAGLLAPPLPRPNGGAFFSGDDPADTVQSEIVSSDLRIAFGQAGAMC